MQKPISKLGQKELQLLSSRRECLGTCIDALTSYCLSFFSMVKPEILFLKTLENLENSSVVVDHGQCFICKSIDEWPRQWSV